MIDEISHDRISFEIPTSTMDDVQQTLNVQKKGEKKNKVMYKLVMNQLNKGMYQMM